MIITCPNCQTRYKVTADAVSAAGRQVQCAACNTAWVATPTFPKPQSPPPDPEPDDDELIFRGDRDTLFSPADEDMLDAAFAKTEEAETTARAEPDETPPAPRQKPAAPDGKLARQRMEALARRRNAAMSALPLSRLRRVARICIGLVLLAVLGLGIGFRTEIVRIVPQLDGLYRLVGLGTNVIGLTFSDVKTLRTTRDGNGVIIVTAKISNITNRIAFVPNVLVSLLGGEGQLIYEWSVTPSARNILPGDVLAIDTQLRSPPQGVERVRLSFVEGQIRPEGAQN